MTEENKKKEIQNDGDNQYIDTRISTMEGFIKQTDKEIKKLEERRESLLYWQKDFESLKKLGIRTEAQLDNKMIFEAPNLFEKKNGRLYVKDQGERY
jgi:hypothetical protein